MKILLIPAITLLSSTNLFAQSDSFKLPDVWDNTFVISISHTGSMSASTSHITFTHDSCKYVSTSRNARPKEKKFALRQADRSEILKKMHELNVENIKAGLSIAVQNDGWSHSLCLGAHCIEGGSASEMSEKDKGIFLTASSYLEQFAVKK